MNLANENDPSIDDQIAQRNAESAITGLLESLGIDWTQDPNTKETPKRVAKMYVKELLRGRFEEKPRCTVFPNTKKVDQLYTVGPMKVTGVCSHHFMPIVGHVWVGVIPSDKLLGLSKFARLAEWVFARPQIQEEATEQLADEIQEALNPIGLGVVCKAEHMCMTLRGVRSDQSLMTTSVMKGALFEDQTARSEFMDLIKGQGY